MILIEIIEMIEIECIMILIKMIEPEIEEIIGIMIESIMKEIMIEGTKIEIVIESIKIKTLIDKGLVLPMEKPSQRYLLPNLTSTQILDKLKTFSLIAEMSPLLNF
jgi:hypothetical protein